MASLKLFFFFLIGEKEQQKKMAHGLFFPSHTHPCNGFREIGLVVLHNPVNKQAVMETSSSWWMQLRLSSLKTKGEKKGFQGNTT